ncbi:MAG: glycosyltransferase family 4 protein [bacterium]
MRICYLTPSYLPIVGGTEIVIKEISKRLARRGHQIDIFTVNYLNAPSFETDGHINIFRTQKRRGKIKIITRQIDLFWEIYKRNKEDKYDLLHLFHPLALGGTAYFIHKFLKIPLVVSFMGTDILNNPRSYNYYLSIVINSADLILSPSQSQIDDAKKIGLKKDVQIIPHGTSFLDKDKDCLKRKTEIRYKLGIGLSEVVILTVNRFDKRKRVDVLLKSYAELIKKVEKVKFIIIGTGPEFISMTKMKDDLGLAGYLFFKGFISDNELKDYYLMSDIFVMHTTHEAFGIVYADAMACALPVVTTTVGAVPEVVVDGETGLLVPPLSPLKLADAILILINNKTLRLEMGLRAQQRAKKLFAWESIVDQYEEKYKVIYGQQFSF